MRARAGAEGASVPGVDCQPGSLACAHMGYIWSVCPREPCLIRVQATPWRALVLTWADRGLSASECRHPSPRERLLDSHRACPGWPPSRQSGAPRWAPM